MAEVSVGTVYNYYRTKGDILIATVALEVEEVLASGESVVENPPDSIEASVLALIFTYYDHSLNYLSKEMWRSAMGLSIEAPDTPNGQRYNELDRLLSEQVGRLIVVLQRRGDIRADLDGEAIGQIIFNTLNQLFIDFIKNDGMSLPMLRDQVSHQMKPLFQVLSAD